MLSARQKQIFDFINNYIASKGGSPSLRDICRKFNIAIGTVQDHIKALKDKGYIEKAVLKHRGLMPSGWSPGLRIPLLGQVSAGQPVLAEENVESYVSVDKNLIKGSKLFALKVE